MYSFDLRDQSYAKSLFIKKQIQIGSWCICVTVPVLPLSVRKADHAGKSLVPGYEPLCMSLTNNARVKKNSVYLFQILKTWLSNKICELFTIWPSNKICELFTISKEIELGTPKIRRGNMVPILTKLARKSWFSHNSVKNGPTSLKTR